MIQHTAQHPALLRAVDGACSLGCFRRVCGFLFFPSSFKHFHRMIRTALLHCLSKDVRRCKMSSKAKRALSGVWGRVFHTKT